MSKEATIFILDVSPSMKSHSYLDIARQTAMRVIETKIFGAKKGDQVDLLLAGTEETSNKVSENGGYSGITSYFYGQNKLEGDEQPNLKTPTLGLLRHLNELPELSNDCETVESDGIIIFQNSF